MNICEIGEKEYINLNLRIVKMIKYANPIISYSNKTKSMWNGMVMERESCIDFLILFIPKFGIFFGNDEFS